MNCTVTSSFFAVSGYSAYCPVLIRYRFSLYLTSTMCDCGFKYAQWRVPFDSDVHQAAEDYCIFVLHLNTIAAGKTKCTDASVWFSN